MAKSLRSKWKRKCRAIKRERYAKKELIQLKKTLGITESPNQEVDMKQISEIANVTDAKSIKEHVELEEVEVKEDGDMEVETVNGKRKFNLKTFRDQHGSYPVWVHPRKIPKRKKNKKPNKSLKRKSKK